VKWITNCEFSNRLSLCLLVIWLRICLICCSPQEGKGIQILSALFDSNQLHFKTSTLYPRLCPKEGCECLKSCHDGFVSCLYKLVKGKNAAMYLPHSPPCTCAPAKENPFKNWKRLDTVRQDHKSHQINDGMSKIKE
jgi:hypothetical protein